MPPLAWDHGQADQRTLGSVGGRAQHANDLRGSDVYTLATASSPQTAGSPGAEPQARGRIVRPMIRLTLTAGIRSGK